MRYTLLILLAFLSASITFAQNTVAFEIKDESGNPLIGATVVIEGSTTGTITNAQGFAKLENLKDGKHVFGISFIGYEESLLF